MALSTLRNSRSHLYPETRAALQHFVSSHACAKCDSDPLEASQLPSLEDSEKPHMMACCGKRLCGACVQKRDLKQMNSLCPVCLGPLINVDVDYALLFHMQLVRRMRKTLWDEGPGKGEMEQELTYANTLSPTYIEEQKKCLGDPEGRAGSARRKSDSSATRRKSDAATAKPAVEKKPLKGRKNSLADKKTAESPKPTVSSATKRKNSIEPKEEPPKVEEEEEEDETPLPPKKKKSARANIPGDTAPKTPKPVKPEPTPAAPKAAKATPKAKRKDSVDLAKIAFLAKTNNKGETKLHQACIKSKYDEAFTLLQDGACPNTKCNNGWTPLHECAQKGSKDIAKALLEAGAVPNVYSYEYTTPLHEAVVSGRTTIAAMLLTHGADKEARDADGKTPYDLAVGSTMKDILENTDSQFTTLEEREKCYRDSFESARSFQKRANRHKLVVYLSNGSQNDVKWARSVVSTHDGRLEQKDLTNEVSYVVIMPPKPAKGQDGDSDASRMALDTDVGYLRALAKGVIVVSADWLKAIEQEGEVVDESEYYITGTPLLPKSLGPSRSRQNSLELKPRLFHGCHFFLKGKFEGDYSVIGLQAIIVSGAGRILSREPNPESIDATKRPFHGGKKGDAFEACTHFIIYEDDANPPLNLIKYNMGHLKALPMAWLIRSVLSYKFVDPITLE